MTETRLAAMLKSLTLLCVTSLSFCLMAVPAQADCPGNLLSNPGFEGGDGGWNGLQEGVGKGWETICGGSHPEMFQLDPLVRHSGRFSQKMRSDGYHFHWLQEGSYCYEIQNGEELRHPHGVELAMQALAQTTEAGSIKGGETYRLSAWVRISGLPLSWEWFRLGIYWLDSERRFLSESRQPHDPQGFGSHDWREISFEAQAPPSAAFAKVYLHHHFAHGIVWYDDICLERVTDETPPGI